MQRPCLDVQFWLAVTQVLSGRLELVVTTDLLQLQFEIVREKCMPVAERKSV